MTLRLLPVALLSACASVPGPLVSADREAKASVTPVVLVHGLGDDARTMEPLAAFLRANGFREVHAVELRPSNGDAPIEELAVQLSDAIARVRASSRSARVDLVGFSMGALVSRFYLQRLDGRTQVRRFVSISGPHHGTLM